MKSEDARSMAAALEKCPPPQEREARLKMVMAADALRKMAAETDTALQHLESINAVCWSWPNIHKNDEPYFIEVQGFLTAHDRAAQVCKS